MKIMSSLVALSLLAGTILSLTACTDSDVAFGAGVVVGVIIGDDDGCCHHHHRPNPPRYHGRHWNNEGVDLQLSPEQNVALKYNLSAEQARILVSRLMPAKQGDLSGLADLGFEKSDLIALFHGENPSASTLIKLGQKMGLDLEQAHQLIQDIKTDAVEAQGLM